MTIRNVPGNGVSNSAADGEYIYEPVFEQVIVKEADLHGFDLGYVADLYAENLYTEATEGVGFRLFGAGSTIFHRACTMSGRVS